MSQRGIGVVTVVASLVGTLTVGALVGVSPATGAVDTGRPATDTTARGELLKPVLRISTDRNVYRYRGTARVRAHLGDTASNRNLTILANPARGKTVVIERGRVDSDGNLTARYELRYDTTFIVKFSGDEQYRRHEATRPVGTKSRIVTSMREWYAKSGGVHLYRLGENGVMHIEVSPDLTGSIVLYQTQILINGRWENTFWGGAKLTIGPGSQHTALVGGASRDRRTMLRCRAHVYGGSTNYGTASDWEKYRVG